MMPMMGPDGNIIHVPFGMMPGMPGMMPGMPGMPPMMGQDGNPMQMPGMMPPGMMPPGMMPPGMMPSGMNQDFSTIRQPQKVDSDDGIPLEDSEDDGVPLEEDDGVPIEEDDGVPLEEDDGVPIEEDDGAPQVTEEDLESKNRDAQFGALLPTSLMLPDDATPKDLPRKLGSPLTMSDLLPASLILNGIDEFEEEEKLPEVDIEKALEALQARKEFTSKVKSAGGKREALKLEKKRKQISRL